MGLLKKLKDKFTTFNDNIDDDIKLNKATYTEIANEKNAKMMNFLFRKKWTTKQWVDYIEEQKNGGKRK